MHIQAYTSLEKITDCLISCILSNGEVTKYHKFISVVVIELSVFSLNTRPEDRLRLEYAIIDVSVLKFSYIRRLGPCLGV